MASKPKRIPNAVPHIHDETYYDRRNLRNLDHAGMLLRGDRDSLSLNGAWHFSVDPYDTGLRTDWSRPQDRGEGAGNTPWDYDLETGETIQVPLSWNTARPEYYYYEGSAWYARRFDKSDLPAGERVFLRIGAAQYDTRVFLNNEFLGNHYGGSTPFYVEVTAKIQQQNLLQLCVNNARTLDRVPMRNTDWFNYGGVYRDVELIATPEVFIKDFFVYLVPDKSFETITGMVQIDGAGQTTATLTIDELGVNEEVVIRDGKGEFTIKVTPDLWSPETPKCYDVAVQCGSDTIRDRVGFREIRVEGTEILLNGTPVFLRGICCHEDDVKLGKATSEEDIRRRFEHARELGCNFVRLAHYPHHELASTIADEVGIMLWEEIPVYWAIDFEDPATYDDAQNQLLELIKRDRNRASVIIWSVGNENPDSDARLSFMSRLAQTARECDPSRLVSAACLVNHTLNRIEDRLSEYLDVIGLNEYFGWYDPDFEKLAELGRNSKPAKPVHVSETGAGAKAGHHGPETELFTEEHMAWVYRKQIEMLRTLDYIKGITPWILYDFRAPRRYNRYQMGYNRKGLIAEDKQTRKLAFDVLREFYEEIAG